MGLEFVWNSESNRQQYEEELDSLQNRNNRVYTKDHLEVFVDKKKV